MQRMMTGVAPLRATWDGAALVVSAEGNPDGNGGSEADYLISTVLQAAFVVADEHGPLDTTGASE